MVSALNLDDFNLDLEPLSDEPELENSLHLAQIVLLLTCLEWWWQDRQDFFAAGNLSIYFQPEQLEKNTFRGPDFFVVLDTPRRPHNSWVVANEGGKFPNIIVEILSPKTAKVDRTTKKDLYQTVFQTPEYFWFHPTSKRLEFKGFRLQGGEYQEIQPNAQGWLWSEQLDLYLGVTKGMLRYFTADGVLVPNFEEATQQRDQQLAIIQQRLEQECQRAEQEHQRARQESQRAEQESQRAAALEAIAQQERQQKERLIEYLRSQNIDPESLL